MRSNQSGENWTKGRRTGRKERELTSRKGMEAEGKAGENTTATRKRGKRNRASQPDRECIGEGGENRTKGRRNEPEADPRGTKVEKNWTQGRGKETGEKRGGNKSAETRGGPALIPTNEPARAGEGSGNAETGSDPGGSGNDRRAPWSARVIYPGRNRPSGRGRTGPCGVSGGDAPPCAEPLLLPPCTKSTDAAHSIRLSIIAERFAPLTSVSDRPSGSRITSFRKARELWSTRLIASGQSFPWV